MGLFDIFKRNKKEKALICNDNMENISKNNEISIRPETVPSEIRELLWFGDGKYRNFTDDNVRKSGFVIDGIKFEVSFKGAEEPSLIYSGLPIKLPKDLNNIDKPGYYPSYKELNAQQRWIYLNWLRDVEKEIDISYVFIFYYGLERHLFFGNFDKAFNIILKLRKYHKNSSFLGYSSDALVAACLTHNRVDAFIKYIENVDEVSDVAITPIYLMAKKQMNMGLVASEIIRLARKVGFTNTRYIKDEKEYFKEELNKVLIERYSNREMPLSRFDLKKCPEVEQMIIANYSLPNENRIIKIRSIMDNQAFSDEVLELLKISHERVKEKIKVLRKQNVGIDISLSKQNNPTKKISEVFKKSPLFGEIDVKQFDENLRCYNNALCPSCKELLQKVPVTKGKCNLCNNTILVKNSEFTGQKILLTEKQYKDMVKIKEDRVYRNWVNGMLATIQIDDSKFAKYIKNNSISIEDGLIKKIDEMAEKEYRNLNLGLYRNCLLQKAKIYQKINNNYGALDLYLLVCYYDLLGCSNGTKKFDKEMAFLAPGIVKYIKKLVKTIGITNEELAERYVMVANSSKDRFNIGVVNNTWSKLKEELLY